MKKHLTTLTLFAVLGTLTVSCQKENLFDQTQIEVEQTAIYKVSYSIDGTSYQITLFGDDAWRDFVKQMIALAEKGHRVTFRNEIR